MVAIFKNIWKSSAIKKYRPASLLFMADKFFEKLVNNNLVNHLEKFGFFFHSTVILIRILTRFGKLEPFKGWNSSKV